MLKPASLQSSYTLAWSLDPSIQLPTVPDGADDATKEKIETERRRLLRNARQTGAWQAITAPGETPTFFTFRQLSHSHLAWVHGEAQRRGLGQLEINDLFFLLALEKVDNFGTVQVKRSKHDGKMMADAAILDELSRALNGVIPDGCALLVAEFVEQIVERARGAVDPL